jgi:hypothetical protein
MWISQKWGPGAIEREASAPRAASTYTHEQETGMDVTRERLANTTAFTFTPRVGIPGTAGADAEAPHVARTGDNVFILWHEFPDLASGQPDIFLARSTNRGASFRPRINLSNSPAAFSAEEVMAVTRSGNNTRVYVVWNEDGEIRFRRDRTNDGTFANPVRLNDTVGASGAVNPRIVASGDHVFVVWQAEPQAGDPTDIFFARSTDAGDTFRDKMNISNSTGDSFDPQIAFIGDDHVIVTWRDASGGDFEIAYVRSQ